METFGYSYTTKRCCKQEAKTIGKLLCVKHKTHNRQAVYEIINIDNFWTRVYWAYNFEEDQIKYSIADPDEEPEDAKNRAMLHIGYRPCEVNLDREHLPNFPEEYRSI